MDPNESSPQTASDGPPEVIPLRPPGCPTAATLTRTVASADLFGGARNVVIEHAGEQYRLTVTRNNKLILQK